MFYVSQKIKNNITMFLICILKQLLVVTYKNIVIKTKNRFE